MATPTLTQEKISKIEKYLATGTARGGFTIADLDTYKRTYQYTVVKDVCGNRELVSAPKPKPSPPSPVVPCNVPNRCMDYNSCVRWRNSVDGAGNPMPIPKSFECERFGVHAIPSGKSGYTLLYEQLERTYGSRERVDSIINYSTKEAQRILAGADPFEALDIDASTGMIRRDKFGVVAKELLTYAGGPIGSLFSSLMDMARAHRTKEMVKRIQRQIEVMLINEQLTIRGQLQKELLKWPDKTSCEYFDISDWVANIAADTGRGCPKSWKTCPYRTPNRPADCKQFATLNVEALDVHPNTVVYLREYIKARTEILRERCALEAAQKASKKVVTLPPVLTAPANTQSVVGLAALGALKAIV